MKKIFANILILAMLIVLTGCAEVLAPSGHMADSMDYVRKHKGTGLRRIVAGSESELMDIAAKRLERSNYDIIREPHAVLAKSRDVELSYTFYFYPSNANDQTEVEVLLASPWLTTEQIRSFQEETFSTILFNIKRKLLEKGWDPNVKVGGLLPLSNAALDGEVETAKKLINIGADLDSAIYELKEMASKQSPYLNYPANRKIYDKANLGVEMLAGLKPRQAEPKTNIATGLTKEDLSKIVQEAVDKASKHQSKESKIAVQSDIDKPDFSAVDRIMGDNDIAVIIGIEGYQGLPKSDYSYDDAKLVSDYAKALGFKPRNIEILLDERATKSAIEKIIKTWLPNKARPDSRVFIYYSGHGAPDPKTGSAYLVPYDGDPNYLSDTGYPLKSLYENLGKLQVAEVTVLLDSCFSGAGGRSVLAKGARPLVMMAESAILPQNIAVLSATQGTQISTSSPEKGHGIFTYYFLKALKDGKKNIAEIYEYIKPLVEDEAKQMNVQQSPSVSPDVEKLKGRFGLRK